MVIHLGWPQRSFCVCILISAALLSCAFPPLGEAQQSIAPDAPVRHHSLTLDAQSVANGGASQVFGNPAGVPLIETAAVQTISDRRVNRNRTNVAINVRNLGTVLDKVRVEWFFVALPVGEAASGTHEVIFHRDAQELAIPGGKTATQIVSSPKVQAVYERATTVTNVPLGYPYSGVYTTTLSAASRQKGLMIRGWMVRLVAEDGAVLASKGSSQAYEDIAANPAKLAGMLARPGAEKR